jgi:hypothetical protein
MAESSTAFTWTSSLPVISSIWASRRSMFRWRRFCSLDQAEKLRLRREPLKGCVNSPRGDSRVPVDKFERPVTLFAYPVVFGSRHDPSAKEADHHQRQNADGPPFRQPDEKGVLYGEGAERYQSLQGSAAEVGPS